MCVWVCVRACTYHVFRIHLSTLGRIVRLLNYLFIIIWLTHCDFWLIVISLLTTEIKHLFYLFIGHTTFSVLWITCLYIFCCCKIYTTKCYHLNHFKYYLVVLSTLTLLYNLYILLIFYFSVLKTVTPLLEFYFILQSSMFKCIYTYRYTTKVSKSIIYL